MTTGSETLARAQVKDLYDPRTQWALYILNALKAKELQKKDVNYIVKSGEIIIVDEFTGRTMVGRRWSDGLHQAVEAKESVPIQNETITIASVTYQSFFRCGRKIPPTQRCSCLLLYQSFFPCSPCLLS